MSITTPRPAPTNARGAKREATSHTRHLAAQLVLLQRHALAGDTIATNALSRLIKDDQANHPPRWWVLVVAPVLRSCGGVS